MFTEELPWLGDQDKSLVIGAVRLVGLGPGGVGRKSLRPAIEVRHRFESGRCRFVWRMTRLCRERTFFGPSETARSTTRPRPNWTKAR
jgi:hypothetical protein